MKEKMRNQHGIGSLGILLLILLGGLVISLALKVVPLYMDDYSVGKVLSSLNDRPDIRSASGKQVRGWFNKGLQTNLVKLERSEVKIVSDYGKINVKVNYERRVNYLYNIDLVLTFKHDWTADSQ